MMKITYLCSMNKLVIVGCGRLAETVADAVVKLLVIIIW